MSDVSPALRQRELGLRLRKERTDREMTVEEVAGKLLWSPEKIHRIETAARRATPRDVRDLCALYGVAGALADELMQLAGGPTEQGWWTQYEDLNLARFIELEQQASSIIQYTMHYVPALLQTEEYAHAIIKAVLPGIDPKIHANRVEARLRRQRVLGSEYSPRFNALIDEGVLRRQLGGAAVMARQLDKILELARKGKAAVEVIPFGAGVYPVSDSNFVFLEFGEFVMQPLVYVEGYASSHYYERAADVALYREAIQHLRGVALNPRDSLFLMEEIRTAYAKNQ